MELSEALDRIDAIRAQVARTRIFRGYRSATIAATGLLGLGVAGLQPYLIPDPVEHWHHYLQLWIGTAVVCVIGVAAEMAKRFRASHSPLQREQTVQAIQSFVPCVFGGATMTLALVRSSPEAVSYLPVLWAIVFSLGIFASCRQLPPAAVFVGSYYMVAGALALALARGSHALSPWAMAGTFGVGQLLTAVVLYFALERQDEEI